MEILLLIMPFLPSVFVFSQDPSVQKVGGGRKKTVSFSSMPSEKKVEYNDIIT